jgi:hypothetical protein
VAKTLWCQRDERAGGKIGGRSARSSKAVENEPLRKEDEKLARN